MGAINGAVLLLLIVAVAVGVWAVIDGSRR